ncbi:DUF2059 domain-containing protein [Vogesella indigofera]|uniref:DUF2059 domain-containing protein n=1 Tax=Vogesella indigofera TaxID=45465 RepID=A0ABT5HZ66_VOGIN|nr:DUF2059 domain-containing protein [Vogesella indigofera]MDC7689209.1 DUF2059 domain-containing protein [Vogesella indigofera]
MKKILFALVFAAFTYPAYAAPPSAASLEQLMIANGTVEFFGRFNANIDNLVRQDMEKFFANKKPTELEKEIMVLLQPKLVAILQAELSWEALKPELIRIHSETLTQEEVDGILALLKTPLGQTLLHKIPQVTERTFEMTGQRLEAAKSKIQPAINAALVELKAIK